MNVICTIIILSAGGYRDVVNAPGVVVKEAGDYFYVDFGAYFKHRRVDLSLQTEVQRILGNSCLLEPGVENEPR